MLFYVDLFINVFVDIIRFLVKKVRSGKSPRLIILNSHIFLTFKITKKLTKI